MDIAIVVAAARRLRGKVAPGQLIPAIRIPFVRFAIDSIDKVFRMSLLLSAPTLEKQLGKLTDAVNAEIKQRAAIDATLEPKLDQLLALLTTLTNPPDPSQEIEVPDDVVNDILLRTQQLQAANDAGAAASQ